MDFTLLFLTFILNKFEIYESAILVPSNELNNNSEYHQRTTNNNAENFEYLQKDINSLLKNNFNEEITTNNPCLITFCPKGEECVMVSNDGEEPHAKCICQRKCPHHSSKKHLLCGSDGNLYANRCALRRAECLTNQKIHLRNYVMCISMKPVDKSKVTVTPFIQNNNKLMTKDQPEARTYHSANATQASTVPNIQFTTTSPNYITLAEQQNTTERLAQTASSIIGSSTLDSFCSSQEYEIMKDNLLLFSHTRLIVESNNHSKNFLVSIMFSHYDQNNDGYLERDEIIEVSKSENIRVLSNGCNLEDMFSYEDNEDADDRLSINEFNQAFSKLYSLSVISLDKVLEKNYLSARVGDNVQIKCDITGSPSPPIVWKRNGIDLSSLNDDDIHVFNDGSLYLTKINLMHSGNYTCVAQRNQDVVQTHTLLVHTLLKVQIQPILQVNSPNATTEIRCHVEGEPLDKVEWLKNDELVSVSKSNKYEVIGKGRLLKIKNLTYSDTGAYMCRAENVGGSENAISSLVVQDNPTATPPEPERLFFVFHATGIDVYEPAGCQIHHKIQGNDIIPGTQSYVCGVNYTPCVWGRAIYVGSKFVYVSQPKLDRVLVVSTSQLIVADIILTDPFPVNLFAVPQYDQVWVESTVKNNLKTIQVVRDASKRHKHNTVHAEPINSQFDLVKNLFVPIEYQKYAYVTHHNQRGYYKLDMENLRYVHDVDLTMYNCVPENIQFSSLYGYVIVQCREPITNRPSGQLILDYLTDAVLSVKTQINGCSYISPDSRHLITVENDHQSDDVVLIVQHITAFGLQFLFDVRTTLNITDVAFFESLEQHSYDLFASASDKEDILFLNLWTGKVEIITGIGTIDTRQTTDITLTILPPIRAITSSGLFDKFMISPTQTALFVIDGRKRNVNCEIGGLEDPRIIVWI